MDNFAFSLIEGVPMFPEYMKKPFRKLVQGVGVKKYTPKPKQPSVLTQYLKAKKEKWRPMLELEDSNE